MNLNTLEELLEQQVRDLYSAETQLCAVLPRLATAATSARLKSALATHLSETEDEVKRLEKIASHLGISLEDAHCRAMKGLIEEAEEIIDADGVAEIIDAGIIAVAQRIEHYEMAGYGTARAFAELLGEDEVADLFSDSLDEEANTDHLLNDIAEAEVNEAALLRSEGAGDYYLDEEDDEDDGSVLTR